MAGTEENPVRLDPWQNIIEVGWPANYITVNFGFGITGVTSANSVAEVCDPWVDPFQPRWDIHMLSMSVGGGAPVANLQRQSGSAIIPTGEASIAGGPTPQSYSWGAWEWVSGFGAMGGFPVESQLFSWDPQTGPTVTGLKVDELNGIFYQNLAVEYWLVGDQFTGGAGCHASASPPFTPTHQAYFCTSHARVRHDDSSLDFSGVTVTYKGRVYNAAGCQMSTLNFTGVATGFSVGVLCIREGDEPAP